MKKTVSVLAVLLAAGLTAAAAAPLEGFFFRSKPGLIASGHVPGPVDPEPEDPVREPLVLNVAFPEFVESGSTASVQAEAAGGTGAYAFSGTGLPSFVTVAADGTVSIAPSPGDAGLHEGIVFNVADGETSAESGPFSILVTAEPSGLPLLPESVTAEGTPMASYVLFDGIEGAPSSVKLRTALSTIEYRYPEPIKASGSYARVGGSYSAYAVDAFVNGAWTELGRSSSAGSRTIAFAAGEVESDRWRLRRRSSTGTLDVFEFRPGPAPVHPVPEFATPSGFLAARGGARAIEMKPASSPYTSSPLVFAFAEGTAVPPGVQMSPDGVVTLAENAAVNGVWQFTVVVTDGVGATAQRVFQAADEAPSAAEIMASEFEIGGEAVDYRYMYDGPVSLPASPVVVRQGRPLLVTYPHPVRADAVVASFSAASGARLSLEYFADGTWTATGPAFGVAASGTPVTFTEIVADRFRLSVDTIHDVQMSDLRIGGGEAHSWPLFVDQAYLATLGDAEASHVLAVAAATTYGNTGYTVELSSGELPQGSGLSQDGVLDLPPASETDEANWSFTLKATDALGFYAEKTFVVGGGAVPASVSTPASAVANGAPADFRVLYDGKHVDGIQLTQSMKSVEIDFGKPVSFDRTLWDQSLSRRVSLEFLAGGEWLAAGEITNSGTRTLEFGKVYVAQKVRLALQASVGSTVIREFRLGAGPAVMPPAVEQSGVVADLSDDEQSVTLSAAADAHYFPGGEIAWSVVGGALPEGASLNPVSGTLDLPRADDVPGAMWTFTVRASDPGTFATDRQMQVIASGKAVEASAVMATSVTYALAPADHKILYDGLTNENFRVSNSQPLVLDFGRTVLFDKVVLNSSSASSSMLLEVETPQGWLTAETVTARSDFNPIQLQATYSTKKVRLTRSSSTVALIREFRVGAGPAHTPPTASVAPAVTLSPEDPTYVQAAGTFDPHYTDQPLAWSVASGDLPSGATLDPDGRLALPSAEGLQGFQWTFVARATDGVGFTADAPVTVSVQSSPASVTMAKSATLGGQPTGLAALYDGAIEPTVNISSATKLTVLFDGPVSFDKVFVRTGTSATIEMEIWDGTKFLPPVTFTSSSGGATPDLGKVWVTDRVRIARNSASEVALREFRLGAGLEHAAPAYLGPAVVADLGSTPTEVSLQMAGPSSYGGHPLRFELAEGALPNGAGLAEDGTLSLPTAAESGGSSWAITVRVTDRFGFSSEFPVRISASANSRNAAVTVPISARGTLSGSGETDIDVLTFYDGVAATAAQVSSTYPLEYVYEAPVSFDRVLISSTSSAIHFEVFVGGQWERLLTTTSSSAQDLPLGGTYVTDRVRLIRSSTSSASVREFRPGAGPNYAPPTLSVPSVLELSQTAAKSWTVTGTVDTVYGSGKTFSLASGRLPSGASLAADGTLSFPAIPAGGWSFTVRIDDDNGFHSESSVLAFSHGDDASVNLPVAASAVGGAVSWQGLYDGNADTLVAVSQAAPLELDYGKPVKMSQVVVNQTPGAASIEALVDGTWIFMKSATSGTSTVQLDHAWTAQRIRLYRAGTNTTVREFRAGNAPVHTAPQFSSPDTRVSLRAGVHALSIAASSPPNYSPGPLSYQVTEGSLPPGSTIDGSTLNLPPDSSSWPGGQFNWHATIRATDRFGLWTETTISVSSPQSATGANVTVPSSSNVAGAISALYDNDNATRVSIPTAAAGGLVLEFENPVNAYAVKWRTTNFTSTLTVEAEYDGRWVKVATSSSVNASTSVRTMNFDDANVAVAKRFRFTFSFASAIASEIKLGTAAGYPGG